MGIQGPHPPGALLAGGRSREWRCDARHAYCTTSHGCACKYLCVARAPQFSVLYLARFEPSFVSIRVASVGVDRVLVPTLVAMSMLINGVSGKLSGAWVSCADLAGGR